MMRFFLLSLACVCCVVTCQGQNLTAKCQTDWERYQGASLQPWALRMSDATGRIESGQLEGNLVFEGNYRECVKVRENETDPSAIRGMYCLSAWNLHTDKLFTKGLGICIPHTCTDDDARQILYTIYVTPQPPSSDLLLECRRSPDLSQDPAAIVSITILSLFGAIVIAATVFDVISQHWPKANQPSGAVVEDGVTHQHKNSVQAVQCTNTVYDGVSDMELCSRKDGSKVNVVNGGTVNQAAVCEDEVAVVQNGIKDSRTKYREPDNNGAVHTGHAGSSYNLHDTQQQSNKPQPGKLGRVLTAFSLYTNVPRLLSARHPPGSFQCLNGLRFLAMSWIVLGHTFQLGLYAFVETPTVENRFPMIASLGDLHREGVNQMWLSVETFFVMSGMLVTISFMKTVKRQGDRVTCRQMALYYFHRYWRLTPVYAIVLMISANLFHYFGNGPLFPYYIPEADGCKATWWQHLLYIQTLMPEGKLSTCLPHVWYLGNDFLFYVMAPVFIVIACFFSKAGLVWMILGYLGSLTANIVLNYQIYIDNKDINGFLSIYIRPWTRAVTYFIGMALGYTIFHVKQSKQKLKIHKLLILCGWLVALTLVPLSVYGVRFMTTPEGTVAFKSVQNSMFALAVAWIIFACVNGYGGIINSLLSWKAWVPLARLSYSCYLIHPELLLFYVYSAPKQLFVYDWFVIYLFLGHMCLSLGFSFVFTLVFEIPMLEVEKVIIPRKK